MSPPYSSRISGLESRTEVTPRFPSFFKTTFVIAGALIVLLGCADRSLQRFQKIAGAASKDDFTKASQEVKKNQKLYGTESALLYAMDLGILYHYAGKYDSSITALSEAVRIHDELFAKSVTNEALAFVANDNIRPYRGKPYEIVLLHEFLAFDYLALGKYDDAMVEARQAQLFLDEVKRKAGKDEKDLADDGMFRYLTAIIYQATQQRDDAAISMYKAVKAYRQGPVALPPSVAVQAAMVLRATSRTDDLKELGLEETTPAAADASGSEIIVMGHAGRSPTLGQNVFWGTYERDGVLVIHYHDTKGNVITQILPAPGLPASQVARAGKGRRTRSGTTFHVKFSMPSKKDVASQTRFFTVAGEASPNPIRTEALTELDPLLTRDLEASYTSILTRTVVRVVLRTFTAEETKSAVSGGNPIINLILNIGTDLLSDQLEQADTRTWFLLPRTVQMARIPVKPGSHSLTIEAHDASGNTLGSKVFENIAVKPGEKKFLFYPSLK
jgi:uncharacterized protein